MIHAGGQERGQTWASSIGEEIGSETKGSPEKFRATASVWTPTLEAMACRLYLDEGMSASDVAAALGCGLSRGAVIGKIRRLGHHKRGDSPARTAAVSEGRHGNAGFDGLAPSRGRRAARAPSWPPQPLPPLREAPLQGPPARLTELADGACRWPVDDPIPGEMHATFFCVPF